MKEELGEIDPDRVRALGGLLLSLAGSLDEMRRAQTPMNGNSSSGVQQFRKEAKRETYIKHQAWVQEYLARLPEGVLQSILRD